ncbi:MAG: CoA transferase [Gammaproteobacteria bacterium]|nr:CoA transferase [Gammaproteobacteria bacterium]
MPGPLDGIRVLEAGLLIQGPQAAALLADMGADVIKIELPGLGDQGRYIHVGPDDPRSAVYTACNRGKRSVALDLRHPRGAGIFKTLARDADVFVSNFKPGTLETWDIGYDDLAEINPGIICAQGSTFGPVGPDADREGADLAGQAAGGLISTIGRDQDTPSPVGVFIADHIASLNLAAGILAALYARTSTGRGQRVEASLLGGQIWAQATEFTHLMLTNEPAKRANDGHSLIKGVYGIFETADGWIAIPGVPPHARDAFFIALDRPDLTLDDRLQGIAVHGAFDWLMDQLVTAFKTQPTEHWCRVLREAGVRYAPVRNHRQVLDDSGAWDNGYFAAVGDAEGEPGHVVGTPIRMSGTPLAPGATAPALGAHTEEVLREIGIGDAELAVLRERKTI